MPRLLTLTALLLAACSSGKVPLGEDGNVYDWEMDPNAGPIPFGFWGLNGFIDQEGLVDLQDRFQMSAFHTSTRHPNYAVNDLLPLVRAAGLQVNLRMVGNHDYYTDANGDFDLTKWKEMLGAWEGSGVQEFIDDGTLANHMMLDDIDDFNGAPPTADELEEMARYSHEILPGLRVIVRADARELPLPTNGSYQELDATVNQYVYQDGDVEEYALSQAERADNLGLDIINGLNIADGGDGTSGQPGWSSGHYAMSAQEIEDYGDVLSAVPGCSMFLLWEYDGEEAWSDGSIGSDYFDQPELQEALAHLGQRLAGEE